jgi:hypothetical protein
LIFFSFLLFLIGRLGGHSLLFPIERFFANCILSSLVVIGRPGIYSLFRHIIEFIYFIF